MTIATLVSERDEVLAERDEFKHRYYQVLEELRLARHHRFGASSEVDTGQGELFDIEDEPVEAESTTEPSLETGKTRRKPKRQTLSKDLPRVVIHHEPEETHCPDCGDELHTIGEDISEKLVFIPAKVEVEQHIRPKCVCRHCEQQGESTVVYQASMPATVFPKRFATPSLVAQVIAMKFQYGLPLTRIASLFGDWGIDISRRTLADWGVQGAEILESVWTHLRSHLLKESALNADETPVKVVDSDKSKTYMWVYCSGTDGPEPPTYN
ncbi:IS66 family transposase, partial [Vibrio vulnificus]|uniref:IS66 family transposase n=1 Tax=Vibrio vulnificus TaxID=672 RepID=UPI001CDC1323